MTRSADGRHAGAVLAGAALVSGALLAPAPGARAQPIPLDLQLEGFEASASPATATLNVAHGAVLPHLQPSAGLLLHFTGASVRRILASGEERTLVDGRLVGELAAAIGLFDRLEIGAVFPVIPVQLAGDLDDFGVDEDEVATFATGDLRIVPKIALYGRPGGGLRLAVLAPVHVPTASKDLFQSDRALWGEGVLAADWRSPGGFTVAVDAGYQLRPRRRALDVVSDDALRWAVALDAPLAGDGALAVVASLFGGIPLTDGGTRPVEAIAALRLGEPDGIQVLAGGGVGLSGDAGVPPWRVLGSLRWTLPSSPDVASPPDPETSGTTCPDPPDYASGATLDRDPPEGCPAPDHDGDGVGDRTDRCPEHAESRNGVRDGDGCPEDPRVLAGPPRPAGAGGPASGPGTTPPAAGDVAEPALASPEEQDLFLPRGGDSDGDGLADFEDDCADFPEDLDSFQDADGCPEADDDEDGVPDADDRCPLVAETKDGFQDADGCPDSPPASLEGLRGAVRGIAFESGAARLTAASARSLEKVLEVLRTHPGLTLLVEGHTDGAGEAKTNETLSIRRAGAVRDWLVRRGIASDRISVRGHGPAKPVATNDTPGGRAQNRRVELVYEGVERK